MTEYRRRLIGKPEDYSSSGNEIIIKKFSADELASRLVQFPLEDFLNETKYVPRIVSSFSRANPSDLFYFDMLMVYNKIVELNPSLNFYKLSKEIKARFNILSPYTPKVPDLSPAEKKCEKKDISLEELVSIVDFEELEKALNYEVIGQRDAIRQLLRPLINTKHMGMPNNGTASFYLLGPSGVGKTSSIKCLSEILDVSLLQIQGSEYQEDHTSRNLFGAPPSYIGYDSHGGILAKFIKENPSSIILFDEIDKVHPKIYEALTSFLGDGFVSVPGNDSKVYFNGWIFFTSNTGNKVSESGMGRDIGFQTDLEISDSEKEKQRVIRILKQEGVGEAFLGRMNGFIRFDTLDHENLRKILDKNIIESNEKLKYYSIELTENAKDEIIQSGEPKSWGARNLVNNLNRFAISELNYAYEMRKNIPEKSNVLVDYSPEENRFRYYYGQETLVEIDTV